MSSSILDVIVIGGGYAGLCASYYLKHFGLEHVIFDQGKVGQSWYSQPWDTLTMITANKLNALPGSNYGGNNPEEFCSADEFVTSLKQFSSKFQLPVSENSKVLAIEKIEPSPFFSVTVSHENDTERKYFCWRILVASGTFGVKKIPSFASLIPPSVQQFHTGEYRRPDQLPQGNVLIVGSGQSGCQVAEELLDEGRMVYLSTSPVRRVPRRYRGKDIVDWLIECKLLDDKTGNIADSSVALLREPILSGVGEQGHTISLQSLARKGAVLLGTMESAEGENLFFLDNLLEHIKYGDDYSTEVKRSIDEVILKNKIIAPVEDLDYADRPGLMPEYNSAIKSLNLVKQNVKTILWATGTTGNFSFIKLPSLDDQGHPGHKHGISNVEGLYFLGFPWLRSRKSNYLFGIKDDAAFVCNKIYTSIR